MLVNPLRGTAAVLLALTACQSPERAEARPEPQPAPTAARTTPYPAYPAYRQAPAPTRASTPRPTGTSIAAKVRTTKLSGVTFSSDDGDLTEACKRIQIITGIPIIVTPKARAVIDGEGLGLDLNLTAPIAVTHVFDLMADSSDELNWTIRNGVVQFVAREEFAAANSLEMYDVRELVFARTVFLPPQIRGIPTGEDDESAPRTGGEAEEKTFFVESDALINNVKLATGMDYWESDENASIDYAESGYLLVKASPEMHRKIARFLGVMH